MGRLKRASAKKGKEAKGRPSLADQILRKKKPVLKKSKVRVEKENKSDPKAAKKIVELAREDNEEPEESTQTPAADMRDMTYLLEGVEIADEAEFDINVDEKYFEKFVAAEIEPELQAAIEQEPRKKRLRELKETPLECFKNPKISKEIFDAYKDVGFVLSKYRSGSVPKALKVVPIIEFYKDLLEIMRPTEWTAAAVYQVTKFFVASAKPAVCMTYFKEVLLPRVRDDIAEYSRLNFHIFNTLCKATHKPAAFFKAILFPLCKSQCTVKEAVIISSVINRCHFPAIHAAAALAKISTFPYSASNCIFMRFILQKRYIFPTKALDILYEYFIGFTSKNMELSLVWHQILLLFVQNYLSYFDVKKSQEIKALIKIHKHHQISTVISNTLKLVKNDS